MAIQAQLYSENLGFPLCGSQDLMMMDNGCGGGFGQFAFNVQQQQQLQQKLQQQQLHMQEIQNQHQHQQRNQSFWFSENNYPVSASKNNNLLTTTTTPTDNSSTHPSMACPSHSLVAQVEKHRQEIDQYLKSQNERLRLILQEQRKQQITTMMKKVELKTQAILRQKDEEIARGASRVMQLEDLLRKLEMENEAWKRVARENEAMVVSLNNTLEQMRERASCCMVNKEAEDAESCCDIGNENRGGEKEEEEEEGETGDSDMEGKGLKMSMMVCRGCNSRSSCILFLPCRHLCSCKACEAFLDSCPVCRMPKKASIEALIF
ncbi:hypothetical protein FEM48_Zijuj09G0168500 [Ziziphus jujuba var. spinosa]|uniref:RING-type domain-containing protein n=1 Tax=Ziziphus jujuba var. spinosa TaxID=714518 RepID=A0A978UU59_ZIZJJ|nr:hypothetical protein FEM48_Zijuj09G0168500 [Ziziphus jujuba var. spinosa]